MPPRQQPRRISRELALLSLSQIKGNPEKLEQVDLSELTLAAIRTLTSEVQDTLETASAEVKRGHNQLFQSETRATTVESAKTMIEDALTLTQTAINRLASAVEFPEIVQLATQHEVRQYAIELIATVARRRNDIDQQLEVVLKDWQLKRLAKIDQDILRLAVAEILFLDIPEKVAINEAVELAKRYSDDDGYRFINGVLRRFTDQMKQK
ncbi:transcription antitermination factor NusB [Crocosphaera watsonii WH 8501]|uniref:Transcription antitermination protein NusB n=6 Tax=Crocosphaera TaxID=263510 RepID=Q4C5Z6_CROWT|nr:MULTISPECIES: transcription antitermination factor NusB [Crocosphaera]EAM51591.1 Antitermination protein NusB [Crocosphaera watsonii WH 8501]EHJ13507.1 Transcription termination protein NusB [Crocosphaera watsonii WH 0003]MCH2245143.1 transcription antitermination factor NusB [Crocosphaera sp.]CCQ53658.1 Transcription termination protein NusB [Crocosphaera watsonii WH 8502]CCQ55516.1 Transcription termination protein NusB [Crocosphaera watsonii WH 0005]